MLVSSITWPSRGGHDVEIADRFRRENAFWQWMGFTIDAEAARAGNAVVTVDVRAEFFQHQGVVHGGVLSALIDSAGAWAFALDHEESLRTINLAVQYLSPVPPKASRLAAQGTVVRAGKRIVIADVLVWRDSMEEVARGQVLYSRNPAYRDSPS